MFFKSVKKCIKWSAIQMACATMVFSPVAMGREAENLNEKKLQGYLLEFGLNQKTTVGEFWEKTKTYYPGYIYKDFEKFVQENKNLAMPEVTVTSAKGTDGNSVPVLHITSRGKTTTVQIYGEKNKWAKVNNAVLSENDFRNVDDAFKHIQAGDAGLKKDVEKYLKAKEDKLTQENAASKKYIETMVKDFGRFKGFPRMSPEQWKAMSPIERAGFIVNMRLMWQDARRVLRLQEISEKEKPNSKAKKFSSFEEFIKIVLGDEAEAAGNGTVAKQKKTGQKNNDGSSVEISAENKSVVNEGAASAPVAPQSKKCIVAGYVSEEGKGVNYGGERSIACSEALIYKSEKYNRDTPEAKAVRDAKFDCQQESNPENLVACNPLVYGYRPNGFAICVDRMKKTPDAPAAGNYQKATWWDGPCDSAAKLTDVQVKDGLKATDSKYATDDQRYDESGKIKADVAQKQINLIEADQFKNNKKDSYSRTKDYLDSVLQNKKRNNSKIDFTIDKLIEGKEPWSREIDDMLVDIQSQFEVEIGEAIQSCEKSVTRKDNVDRNQKGACDQLHHRWLFTERFISQFRAKSCPVGSTYIWELNQSQMSKDQIDIAKFNKTKLDSENKCKCINDPNKRVSFKDKEGCSLPPPPPNASCPQGMEEHVKGFCSCQGGTEFIAMNEAIYRAGYETVARMCPAKPEKSLCDQPEGIEGYNYVECKCFKGELKNENEQGFVEKYITKREKKEPKWSCKESSSFPWWPLLAIPVLAALFHRHKAVVPIPPVKVCTLTCSANEDLNRDACRCDPKPPPVIECPKGTVKTANGCQSTSEGGSGNSCKNPPCSGGLPPTPPPAQ